MTRGGSRGQEAPERAKNHLLENLSLEHCNRLNLRSQVKLFSHRRQSPVTRSSYRKHVTSSTALPIQLHVCYRTQSRCMVKGGRDRCEDLRINCRFRLPTYIGQFLSVRTMTKPIVSNAISDVALFCHKLVDGWMGFPGRRGV